MAQHRIDWHRFGSVTEQAETLAERISTQIQTLLDRQERARLCLPGGKSPQLFLQALSQQALDWSRVTVLLNDERWVPLDHPQSNEAMLREHLVCHHAKAVQVLGFYQTDLSLEDAVSDFNQQHGVSLSVDLCVLGMGEDGHTASLFPGMPNLVSALDASHSPALLPAKAPDNSPRVSLNLSALLTASQHYLLINGRSKQQVLQQASEEKDPQWPISYLTAMSSLQVYTVD